MTLWRHVCTVLQGLYISRLSRTLTEYNVLLKTRSSDSLTDASHKSYTTGLPLVLWRFSLHTCNKPSDRIICLFCVDLCFKFKNRGFQKPRLKDQVALLFVVREPVNVNVTLSHRQIKPRMPSTAAIVMNNHTVRQRRYFVFLAHFRTAINQLIHLSENQAARITVLKLT